MSSRIERFLLALMFAIVCAGITLIVAQAGSQPSESGQSYTQDCNACHSDFMESWMSGPHGTALSDPIFNEAWTEQGQPGACLVCHTTGYDPATGTWSAEGVTCAACHNPIPTNHPSDPMPVDKTTDLCGTCHSDSRFGWEEWKISAHYQRNMTCSVCHDVHSAGLKTVVSSDGQSYDDASGLCINCHQEYAMNFPYTSHHEQGLSCVNCHVTHQDTVDETAHGIPDHSFHADLVTCTQCHEEQMHGVGDAVGGTDANAVVVTPTPDELIASEPKSVSPLGFAGLAGLVGLAAGMVLSPWLERLVKKINKKP